MILANILVLRARFRLRRRERRRHRRRLGKRGCPRAMAGAVRRPVVAARHKVVGGGAIGNSFTVSWHPGMSARARVGSSASSAVDRTPSSAVTGDEFCAGNGAGGAARMSALICALRVRTPFRAVRGAVCPPIQVACMCRGGGNACARRHDCGGAPLSAWFAREKRQVPAFAAVRSAATAGLAAVVIRFAHVVAILIASRAGLTDQLAPARRPCQCEWGLLRPSLCECHLPRLVDALHREGFVKWP